MALWVENVSLFRFFLTCGKILYFSRNSLEEVDMSPNALTFSPPGLYSCFQLITSQHTVWWAGLSKWPQNGPGFFHRVLFWVLPSFTICANKMSTQLHPQLLHNLRWSAFLGSKTNAELTSWLKNTHLSVLLSPKPYLSAQLGAKRCAKVLFQEAKCAKMSFWEPKYVCKCPLGG